MNNCDVKIEKKKSLKYRMKERAIIEQDLLKGFLEFFSQELIHSNVEKIGYYTYLWYKNVIL